jgi:two-component system cell cycle response regulator
MDPLVRCTAKLQELFARALGSFLAIGFAGALVLWHRAVLGDMLAAILAAGWVLSTASRLRASRRVKERSARLEVELFLHLSVGTYALVLTMPGGLSGPHHALVYLVVLLAAAVSRPLPAVLTGAFVILLEAALRHLQGFEPMQLGVHVGLVLLFSFANVLLLRGEVSEVRQLLRRGFEEELLRMRESARSYRLGSQAPSPGTASAPLPRADEPLQTAELSQLSFEDARLQGGVQEIGEALRFALDLLRHSLGLRSAVLLCLEPSGKALRVQAISTSEETIHPGPFSAKDGLFGAVLKSDRPLSLAGSRVSSNTPYYVRQVQVGAAAGAPYFEGEELRGLLMVDRSALRPFATEEEELLACATRFLARSIQNEQAFVHLERAKGEQGKLYRAVERLASARSEAEVIEAGVASARAFAAFEFAAVTLFHKETREHEICAVSSQVSRGLVGRRFVHNSGLVSMVVENNHPLPYRGQYDPSCQLVFSRQLTPPELPSLVVLPLSVHGKALGTIVLGSCQPHAFGEAVRPTLEVLCSHVAMSLTNARLLKRLEEMATVDGLTGLLNKRAFTELSGQKIRAASRFKKPMALLVCDIDHFKKVNDTHGHDVGDLVIRGFGEVLRKVKRDIDIVGRFGGEEFVVLCEETDEAGAALLAERIRTEFGAAAFHAEKGKFSVTCSVGIATFPVAAKSWEALFKAADEALYASKRAGRDRVTVWSPKLQAA